MPRNKPIEALHPGTQANDQGARIIAAVERLGEVLRNLAWDAAAALDISPLHVQMLAYLHGHGTADVLAVNLAAHFHLTKPTVSVALRTLENKGLIITRTSKADRRARAIALTSKGRDVAKQAVAYLDGLLPLVRSLSDTGRTDLYAGLFKLLDAARQAGMVRVDRMCWTCAHYKGDRDGKHHCLLLRKDLKVAELRTDCPEHEVA